jgi:hypothetical protein
VISEPRPEHPHRCTAGHRWQHTGPAALQCVIAAYDSVTGDLPFVPASECPVCCGRQDLLVRELHPHYCNLCDGDWDHEGVCVDSLAAYCPWCFPKTDAEPVPGARRGPHFHYCSECGHNWQHDAACAAPLRVALPECTACRAATAEITEAPPPEPELVLPLPVRRPRAVGGRVSRLARPIGIAAAVLLSLPILYTGYVSLMRPAVDGSRPATKAAPTPASIASPPAAPAPSAPSRVVPAPPTAAPAVAAIKPEPEPRAAKAAPALPTATVPRVEERRIAPRDSPGEQRAARAAEQRVAEARAAQQRAADARAAEQRAAEQRVAEVRVAEQRAADARVAQQRAAVARPAEQRTPDASPRSDAPPVAARPSAPDAGRTDDTRPNVVMPAPPKRSEVAAQTAPPAQAAPPPADASAVRPTPMVVNLPSIPGAPPFGGLNGGSGRDPSLDGHPRRVLR